MPLLKFQFAQSARAVEYTDCTYEGVVRSPTSILEMTLFNTTGGSGNAGALGNLEYNFTVIAPSPLWPRVVAPDKGPVYGLNRNKPRFLHYTEFFI